jgi:hypothetical protein
MEFCKDENCRDVDISKYHVHIDDRTIATVHGSISTYENILTLHRRVIKPLNMWDYPVDYRGADRDTLICKVIEKAIEEEKLLEKLNSGSERSVFNSSPEELEKLKEFAQRIKPLSGAVVSAGAPTCGESNAK